MKTFFSILCGIALLAISGCYSTESKISSKVSGKNTPIYIYCRSGRRAGTAVEKLKAMGYTDLHNLGGLKDAREKLDLPIKK